MHLHTLIQGTGLKLTRTGEPIVLSDLTDDSRRAGPGVLFIARDTGDERWKDHAHDAAQRGVAALVLPTPIDLPVALPQASPASDTPTPIDQTLAGRLAARFFGNPAHRLKLIGVTGTNGKTTVATLTQHLLRAAGTPCGLLGTVAVDHGSPRGPQPAELTTPGAIELHRHLAAMVENGCRACAMEVSSHALDQGRVAGLAFDVAVFTNLTQDHLDYHGSMERYAAAKAKLFQSLDPQQNPVAVLNVNDPHWQMMRPDQQITTFATELDPSPTEPDAAARDASFTHFSAHVIRLTAAGSTVRFSGPFNGGENEVQVELPIVGRHNIVNTLQAVAAAEAIRPVSTNALAETLTRCPQVPGRLEAVSVIGTDHPAVLVDYAHTPDALENVIAALRPLSSGKLIVVFGCGGDRDRTKRPIMAKLASDLADHAILTSDNPRTEDPQRILDDAMAGVADASRHRVSVEIDRAHAIAAAIRHAQTQDTVLIAGKGHEDYQILGTEKIHFDDREHAAAALARWAERGPS
ncbi:MAG: UDP-N-acetylmuramoyl-L-alanyl-D-glutamate--2,6-diaminopimelate ligase [Planctomycetota bacterium]